MLRKNSRPHLIMETASFDTGGLEKVILDSAILFEKSGYRVTIISSGKIGLLAKKAKDRGIRVVGVKGHWRLGWILLRDKPIASISHFAELGYPIYKLFRIPNITFIHNVYAFLDDTRKKKLLYNDRFVSRYISVSESATRYAVKNLKIKKNKIVTIPNGIIVSEFEAVKENASKVSLIEVPEISDQDFIFLNVAAYNLHKGHYLMASALKEVIVSHPRAKILCIGSEVYLPHLEELKAYLKDQKIEKNMILAGHFQNVAPFYTRADCFLLPSFIEGWSIAMTEAMFYQLPMILTSVGGAPEVIVENDIGITVPNEYGDVEKLDLERLNELAYSPQEYETKDALVSAMIEMIDKADYWRAKARHARRKVIEEYDFSDVVLKYIEQIELVVGMRRHE